MGYNLPLAPPGGWGSQKPPPGAPIDWGHPLACGMLFFHDLAERIDLAQRETAAFTGCQKSVTPVGPAMNFTLPGSVAALASSSSSSRLAPAALTITACVRPTAVSSGRLMMANWSGTYPLMMLRYQTNASPVIYLGPSNLCRFSAAAWTRLIDGRCHVVSFAVPGSGQSDVSGSEMWIDGIKQGYGTILSSGPQSTKTGVPVVGHASDVNYAYGGDMAWIVMHDRHLAADAIRQLHAEPFCMFASGDGPAFDVSNRRRRILCGAA